MKKQFSIIALSIFVFLSLFFTQSVQAADPTPSLNSPYCDFSGGGVNGQATGNVTITTSCAVYENETGVSGGDLVVDGGVVTLHKKLGFSTTGQIDVINEGLVYVNTGGEIIQGIICVKDADGDNYADTISVTTDPYGVPLTTAITQIEQKIFTTPGCPTGYTSRADIENLTIADTDFTSIDPAKIATSDRELLRLGFVVEGISDAFAAASDVQIIDKNLMVCTGGVCPATNFATLTPATGNIYTAGKVGIGITNPSNPLDVTGTGKFTGNLILSSTDASNYLEVLDSGSHAFRIQTRDNSAYLDIKNNGATTYMSIGSTGVGIGKTNPAVALDVTGASNFTGNVGVGGTLTVTGNANICELKTYTAGSGTVTCTAGFYTWAGVASAAGGQMLCCKVSNPI